MEASRATTQLASLRIAVYSNMVIASVFSQSCWRDVAVPGGGELLRQRIVELKMEIDAATTARHAAEEAAREVSEARAKKTERDAALAAWVAAERTLGILPASERDVASAAADSTAEFLAATLEAKYLMIERALRVPTEA